MNGQDLAKRAQDDPQGFWADMAKRLDWVRMPTIIDNSSFHAPVSIKWYEDGILNVCYNCVDRHVPQHGQKTAIIWQGDAPDDVRHISFAALKDMVSQTANALLARGVKAGDRITIYMPMVPEAAVAMLACARIGAIHSVVFGGFSAEALCDRITDCQSQIVITADEGVRGGKTIPLKTSVDTALEGCPYVHTVIVLRRTGTDAPMQSPRDIWWHALVDVQSTDCPCVPMNAEDPLFILYTSGSTGKPKGVLHTSGGYLVYASLTHAVSFGVQPNDIHWCTADVGWVTGHSYIVYGPLANATTTLMFEGVPHYPDWGRFWDVVDQHKVSIFYTAPTAIRALIREGDAYVKRAKRTSLRVLGSVGEPINREAWEWYANVVGDGRCPVIDTYWQTETGGHIISPNPDTRALKAGAAMSPFAGVSAALVDAEGRILEGAAEGGLVMARAWPGLMRTVFGDHARFEQTYFSTYKGLYFTGDGARRDADGDYWITGRVDDVINVSGHRFGTAEIESAINRHVAVAESAVVGFPHDIKGQGIYAYVILKEGYAEDPALAAAISQQVRSVIGAIASLDHVHFTAGLPKTRSGKIMRRILRKIAAREYETLGDTSTLADPAIVDDLIKGRP